MKYIVHWTHPIGPHFGNCEFNSIRDAYDFKAKQISCGCVAWIESLD